MKRFYVLFFLLILCEEYFAAPYRQEGAVVRYCNRKYYSSCFAITKREKRGQPYKTNMTATTLQPWYNNVTINISYGIAGYTDMLNVKTKACEIAKTNWFSEYLRAYSNIGKRIKCPVSAGSYGIFNIELPPKNFPLPVPKGDITVRVIIEQTETKEKMLEISLVLHEG